MTKNSGQSFLKKNLAAFTIIELSVVIATITFISSLIFVFLSGALAQANDGKRKVELDTLRKSLEFYSLDHNRYPESSNWIKIEEDADQDPPGPFTQAMQPYLPIIPRDPLYPKVENPGQENEKVFSYQYKSSSGGKDYKIHIEYETGQYASEEVHSEGGGNIAYPGGGGPGEAWKYRRPITITENSGNDLTDYQINLTLDTASLIAAGKMRTDCQDITFTDSDGLTEINYWLETGCNTTSTKLWVKLPSIPALSSKTIYIYYDNPEASSVSNFDNVFTKDYEEVGLVGLWHMDKGTGTTTADSSGQGNTGYFGGEPTWLGSDGGQWNGRSDVKFSIGSSLIFDGIDDYVEVPDSDSLDVPNKLTVMAWIKPESVPSTPDWRTIVSKQQGWPKGGYGIITNQNQTRLYFFIQGEGVAWIEYCCLEPEKWYFVGGTYDKEGPGNNLMMYVNELSGGQAINYSIYPTTKSLYMGGDPTTGGSFAPYEFYGTIDEVRIYNRALPSEEMKTHYERRKYISPEPTVSLGSEERL